MADKALPIIFINLSGEMIYVIQQRLEAQKISKEKSFRVLQDIICAILNDQFLQELFTPQNMYSRSAMQSVFEKLAHSSIMRLNSNSMAKLYDLMLMVFKYQVINCQNPEDILLVTLNHLDAIRDIIIQCPDLKMKVENLHNTLIKRYKTLTSEEYKSLYDCVELFLQDLNIRVSVLMKLGLQSQTGEIIKTILKDDKTENYSSLNAECSKNLHSCDRYELYGERGLQLGTNIYVLSKSSNNHVLPSEDAMDFSNNTQAVEEINLLGLLIGRAHTSDYIPEILFPEEDNSEEICIVPETDSVTNTYVNIDASKDHSTELGKISKELCIKEETSCKNDILELLDIAENA